MNKLKFAHFALGPLSTNCYLAHDGKEAVMFDVGGDPADVLRYLGDNALRLTAIYNTHLHFDHVYGNRELSAAGARIFANERDAFLIGGTNREATLAMNLPAVPEFEFNNLDESDIDILGASCLVLATPGHTPGGLSYYLPEYGTLFCGDVLFYRAVGRSDFSGGDAAALKSSIRNKLYALPDDTLVCPGHDLETTIGNEKQHNPYVRG